MSLIGSIVGNYEVVSILGEGGMGAVYLAKHPLIGKRVAVKVLKADYAKDEQTLARFFLEAKAVNDVGHPNIVDVIDYGRMVDGGAAYIIMERLEGESLASRLRRGPMAPAAIRHVLGQCCSALAASHAKGIVHRDLKPDNIFLCERGDDRSFVKLLDFGIAKLVGDAAVSPTQTGQLIGTPAYMSPEQCGRGGPVDARSDVYSLGVVLYQMLVGRLPFPGPTLMDMLSGHLLVAPPPPRTFAPDVPATLEAVALRALEKDPAKRYQTMTELAAALGKPLDVRPELLAETLPPNANTLASGLEATAAAHTPAEPAPVATTMSGAAAEVAPPRVRRGFGIALGLAVVIAGGGAVALKLATGGAPPPPPDAKPRARVEVPVTTIEARIEKPSAVEELASLRITALEPPSTAPLAHGGAATEIADVAHKREVVERAQQQLLIDFRAGIVALDAKLKRDDPGYAAAYANLDKTRQSRTAQARASQLGLEARLLALLSQSAASLTADGMFLRAELLAELAEERYDAQFETWQAALATGVPPGAEPKPDYRDALAAIDKLLTDAPDTAYRASALYLKAYARERAAFTPDDQRAAASSFLQIAYEFPSAPITESAYSHAGDFFFGGDDHESLANAAQAYTWIADEKQPTSTALHASAIHKLAKTYGRMHEREKAIATFCRLLAEPGEDAKTLAIDAPAELADLVGDGEQFRATCAHGPQCPCLESVATVLAETYIADDDDADAQSVLELAAVQFPLGLDAPRTACALVQIQERARSGVSAVLRDDMRQRFAPGESWARQNIAALRDRDPIALTACPPGAHEITAASEVDRATKEVRASRGVRRCYDHARRANPMLKGQMTIEVGVGAAGRADAVRAATSTLDPTTTDCVVAAFRRHRWYELDERTVVVPLQFVPST